MKSIRRVFSNLLFHRIPATRLILSVIYLVFAVTGNFFLQQVFCMPVWWASIWASLCIVAILAAGFVKSSRANAIVFFVMGTAVPVLVYQVIFLFDPWAYFIPFLFYIVAILFLGLGLLAFFPAYLLYHVYRYYRVASYLCKKIFWVGCLTPVVAFIIYSAIFSVRFAAIEMELDDVTSFEEEQVRRLRADYFTERVLGIGFKYHTTIDFYDGWRPPLHDPFLNAFLWFSNFQVSGNSRGFYPINQMSLDVRIKYYHALFPNQPLKVNCPCSYTKEGMRYFDKESGVDIWLK